MYLRRDIVFVVASLLVVLMSCGRSKDAESEADNLLRNGLAQKEKGQYAEADAAYKKALSIYEDALGKNHPKVATCLVNMSKVYAAQGRWSDVESVLKRATSIDKATLGLNHLDVGLDLQTLSSASLAQKHYDDAEKYAQEALNVFKSQAGSNREPAVALGLRSLADIQIEEKKYDDAEKNYKEAIAVYENMARPPAVGFADVLRNYSELLRRMGRESEASAMAARSETVRQGHP